MIGITGAPFFSKRIVEQLKNKDTDVQYVDLSQNLIRFRNSISDFKIIHFIGSPTVSKNIIKLIICKLLRKKVVVTWIGFDVRRTKYEKFRRFMTIISKSLIDTNNATSKNLTDDLQNIGIKADCQPIPVYSISNVCDFPSKKRALVYLPDNLPENWNFYQGDLVKKLVNDFADIEFFVVKNSGARFSEKNVTCYSWIEDMNKIYEKVRVVIRLPLEDATSGMILEALSMGRYVIASNSVLEHCCLVNSYDELKKAFQNCIDKSAPNHDASKYVHENYDNSRLADNLLEVYSNLD